MSTLYAGAEGMLPQMKRCFIDYVCRPKFVVNCVLNLKVCGDCPYGDLIILPFFVSRTTDLICDTYANQKERL